MVKDHSNSRASRQLHNALSHLRPMECDGPRRLVAGSSVAASTGGVRIASDIGGTFTDVVAERGGQVQWHTDGNCGASSCCPLQFDQFCWAHLSLA